MNFTREPIIETIISPKDGYKLCVRSSKGGSAEEYFVDAVEVVSFGKALFFRCLERPKAFLVPATDYELLEVKETRVALKNVSHERNIKIGGGRDAPPRPPREMPIERAEEPASSEEQSSSVEEGSTEVVVDGRGEKKRDRRRHRRRRLAEERKDWVEKEKQAEAPGEGTQAESSEEGGGAHDETKVSSSMFSTLFPPPPTLISETISRYKDKEGSEGHFFTKKVAPNTPTEETSGGTEDSQPQNFVSDDSDVASFASNNDEDEDFPISSLFTPPKGDNPDEEQFPT